MSKYEAVWQHVKKSNAVQLKLTFAEVEAIAGQAMDHSFLNSKKECLEYGYEVGKISLKEKTVIFNKISEA